MRIETVLPEMKRDELREFAKKLKIKNYSRFNKQDLMSHIMTLISPPWWKDWKALLSIIASFASIIGLIISIVSYQSSNRFEKIIAEETSIANQYITNSRGKNEGFETVVGGHSPANKFDRLEEASKILEIYNSSKVDHSRTHYQKHIKKELVLAVEKLELESENAKKEALKALKEGNFSNIENIFKSRRRKESYKGVQYSETIYILGNIYFAKLNFDKALSAFLDAQKLDSGNTEYLTSIGVIYYTQGDYKKSLEYFRKALDIDRKIFGNVHQIVARDLNNLGSASFKLGKHQASVNSFKNALNVFGKTLGENHLNTKIAKENLYYVTKSRNNKPIRKVKARDEHKIKE